MVCLNLQCRNGKLWENYGRNDHWAWANHTKLRKTNDPVEGRVRCQFPSLNISREHIFWFACVSPNEFWCEMESIVTDFRSCSFLQEIWKEQTTHTRSQRKWNETSGETRIRATANEITGATIRQTEKPCIHPARKVSHSLKPVSFIIYMFSVCSHSLIYSLSSVRTPNWRHWRRATVMISRNSVHNSRRRKSHDSRSWNNWHKRQKKMKNWWKFVMNSLTMVPMVVKWPKVRPSAIQLFIFSEHTHTLITQWINWFTTSHDSCLILKVERNHHSTGLLSESNGACVCVFSLKSHIIIINH